MTVEDVNSKGFQCQELREQTWRADDADGRQLESLMIMNYYGRPE